MQHQINIAVMFKNVIMLGYSLVFFPFSLHPFQMRPFVSHVHILHILNKINMRRNVSLNWRWTSEKEIKMEFTNDRIHLQRWMIMKTRPVPFSSFSIRYLSYLKEADGKEGKESFYWFMFYAYENHIKLKCLRKSFQQ